MSKFCIILGSPRPEGNTAVLLKPFIEELENNNCEIDYVTLHDKDIRPCQGCYECQDIEGFYGCALEDDVPAVMDKIIACDYLILATPIYSWYCPAPLKALLDRHYGLNKYYGKAQGSLWAGKKVAIIATHGYKQAYACEPFETGIKRLCKHSKLNYLGLYSVRDINGKEDFVTEEAQNGVRRFALKLLEK